MRLLGLLAVAGSQHACDSAFCVEGNVHISQGVYGRVTYQTDVSPDTNPPKPVPNKMILVADTVGGNVIASGISDEDGVFQISMEIGRFAVCYGAGASTCEALESTSDTQLVRADLHTGQGTYWSLVPHSTCAD